MSDCPFCSINKAEYFIEGEYSYAKFDGYPVTNGHVLITSKEHVPNFFELSDVVKNDMMKLVSRVKELLDNQFGTSDYNVGINCGYLAGQTIDHVHIHLIPRREGDIEDPLGGVMNFTQKN